MFGYMGFVTDVSASAMGVVRIMRGNADEGLLLGEVGNAGKAKGGHDCGILEDCIEDWVASLASGRFFKLYLRDG